MFASDGVPASVRARRLDVRQRAGPIHIRHVLVSRARCDNPSSRKSAELASKRSQTEVVTILNYLGLDVSVGLHDPPADLTPADPGPSSSVRPTAILCPNTRQASTSSRSPLAAIPDPQPALESEQENPEDTSLCKLQILQLVAEYY